MDVRQIVFKLNERVQAIHKVYLDFLSTMQATLVLHINGLDSVQFEPRAAFQIHAHELSERYLSIISAQCSVALEATFSDAYAASDAVLFHDGYLSAVRETLLGKIQAQMLSDIHQQAQALQHFLIRVRLLQHQQGLSKNNAVVSERERFLRHLKTVKIDSLGRRRDSKDAMWVEINGTLFRFYNTVQVASLIWLGHTHARVNHPDGDTEVFLLDEYDLVLSTIHPRSQQVFSVIF